MTQINGLQKKQTRNVNNILSHGDNLLLNSTQYDSPEKYNNMDHKNLPPTAIHLMMVSQSLLHISNIAIKNEIEKQENNKKEM